MFLLEKYKHINLLLSSGNCPEALVVIFRHSPGKNQGRLALAAESGSPAWAQRGTEPRHGLHSHLRT